MIPFQSTNEVETFIMKNLTKIEAGFSLLGIDKDDVQLRCLVLIRVAEEQKTLDALLKLLPFLPETKILEIELVPYDHPGLEDLLGELEDYYLAKEWPAPSAAALEALWNK